MSALKYIPSDEKTIYYTQSFRDELEHHLPMLRLSIATKTIMIDPHDTLKFKFDLDGYLLTRSIPSYMHWLIARMNGMSCSQDFGPDYPQLLIPDISEIDRIRQIFTTSKN